MILFLSHHLFRGYLNLFLGSTGCKTVRLKLHVWFFGSFARWNFNAGCLVNCWMLELKSTFFPFSIVPVVSRSIYLSYLILSYPIHRSCNSPPPKKKTPQAFCHQRDTTPAMRSPTVFSCGGTFCSTMPQVLRLETVPSRKAMTGSNWTSNVSNAQNPYDMNHEILVD